jgi:hypothetical protein
LEGIDQAKTEELLEEAIVSCPELLLEGLRLVGRQTDTPGGPLDLLGVDSDGQLVVFELKRGTLTREAVVQVIDYGSYLVELDPEELSDHISERSGKLGVEKIEDFLSWYQEQFARTLSIPQKPRLILVGLGTDDRARRMVSFLADSEVDISLITFHAFTKEGKILLARQVEVEARPPTGTSAVTKKSNLAQLQKNVANLGVGEFYYEMARFFQKELSAYQWPNLSGYSYYLPELTESGSESNRVFVSLYLSDTHRGEVQVRIHPRAVDAASDFLKTRETPVEHMQLRSDGGAEIWINSLEGWNERALFFKKLCSAIVAGWKKRRERQAKSETQPENDVKGDFDEQPA